MMELILSNLRYKKSSKGVFEACKCITRIGKLKKKEQNYLMPFWYMNQAKQAKTRSYKISNEYSWMDDAVMNQG